MFGADFRRDRHADGLNALLNYGYTVLRAATARAVLAAGLHPTLGLHHSNMGNAMRLVDDLMEPFRPLVDYGVWVLRKAGELTVDGLTKQYMVHLLYQDLQTWDWGQVLKYKFYHTTVCKTDVSKESYNSRRDPILFT